MRFPLFILEVATDLLKLTRVLVRYIFCNFPLSFCSLFHSVVLEKHLTRGLNEKPPRVFIPWGQMPGGGSVLPGDFGGSGSTRD